MYKQNNVHLDLDLEKTHNVWGGSNWHEWRFHEDVSILINFEVPQGSEIPIKTITNGTLSNTKKSMLTGKEQHISL